MIFYIIKLKRFCCIMYVDILGLNVEF